MTRQPIRYFVPPLLLAFVVAALWVFPRLWYRDAGEGKVEWLSETTTIPDWEYHPVPVEESAEKVLVADRMFNGVFKQAGGGEVYVFSAKRYEEKANEIGLFIHTPDRCWVDSGWKIEAEAAPFSRTLTLHGLTIPMERRVFDFRGRRELVYFFGLQGGRPLPYRLDHYFSTALRSANRPTGGTRDMLRVSDSHFWGRLWESFKSRRQFLGPKQFIRVSTQLDTLDAAAADQRLETFLERWLTPGDYEKERDAWKLAAAHAQPPALSGVSPDK